MVLVACTCVIPTNALPHWQDAGDRTDDPIRRPLTDRWPPGASGEPRLFAHRAPSPVGLRRPALVLRPTRSVVGGCMACSHCARAANASTQCGLWMGGLCRGVYTAFIWGGWGV